MDVIARFVNPLLMILMPLALGAILERRLKVSWGLFFVGALAFLGSQVLHIPFNAFVLAPALEQLSGRLTQEEMIVVAALALGLSAGLFEETARYLAIRSRRKNERTWRNSLMIGAGHGGAESIALGLLVFYAFLQALALLGSDLTALGVEDAAATEAQLAGYWSGPWYFSLLGALERASALCIQMTLSIIVLQVFLRRNWFWLGLAIAIHTLANAFGLLALQYWGPYWAEAVILAMALAGIIVILKLRSPDPPAEAEPPPDPPVEPIQVREDLSSDQLEGSRYV